jgi:hypothetical protein
MDHLLASNPSAPARHGAGLQKVLEPQPPHHGVSRHALSTLHTAMHCTIEIIPSFPCSCTPIHLLKVLRILPR